MDVLIIIFICSSAILGTVATLIGISTPKERGVSTLGHLLYVLSCVLFLVSKEIECTFYAPTYFIFLYLGINAYFVHWLVTRYNYGKKIASLVTSHLEDAKVITWDDLQSTEEFNITKNSKRLSITDRKIVFESYPKTKTQKYFSDFRKEFHLLEGWIIVHFKDGIKEELRHKNDRTIIREYEIHSLECSEDCKMLVTCIK